MVSVGGPAIASRKPRQAWLTRRRLGLILTHFALLAATAILTFPVLYAVITRTLSFQDVFSYPPRLLPGSAALDNYLRAWEKVHLGRLLVNSALIAVAVSVGKIALSLSAAFAFAYFPDLPGKTLCLVLILITHMLPLPVRIVPIYQLMQAFGWVNTYWALTVPFLASATGTLLFRQFFLTMPTSLSDAASLDGDGPLRFLLQILIPLSWNNIAALFTVEFLYMWNQYLWPLIVTTSDDMRVAQIGIKMLIATDAQAEWNVIMAGVTIVMLPPVVVLFALQRQFVRSVSLGGEK
jgi:sn-glycerol 3-phosphate transport system permease protein